MYAPDTNVNECNPAIRVMDGLYGEFGEGYQLSGALRLSIAVSCIPFNLEDKLIMSFTESFILVDAERENTDHLATEYSSQLGATGHEVKGK